MRRSLRFLFQSTLPVRGATRQALYFFCAEIIFQSTLPVRGATAQSAFGRLSASISIHAPRAGSDVAETPNLHAQSDFNPRSPCGERRLTVFLVRCGPVYFNPRSPCGERRECMEMRKTIRRIFQSTLPVRGATVAGHLPVCIGPISIHAPRAGSDHMCLRQTERTWPFQSTLPVRGATSFMSLLLIVSRISIHAPRAGSDKWCPSTFAKSGYFNPRSPCGERRPYSPQA